MKRLACAAVLAAASMVMLTGAGPTPHGAPPIGGPIHLPDLVITSFGFTGAGPCKPGGATLFNFQVTVKNQGDASWSANGPEASVVVADLHVGDAWGTGASFPPLAPGQSVSVPVHVGYFTGDPAHMTLKAPHPFQAVVNRAHTVPESNYANNASPGPAAYEGVKVIMMGAPAGCK